MKVALTTVDNPYSPFVQFDEWYAFDNIHGYHTCEYLARAAKISSDLPIADTEKIIEDTIDGIVKINPLGLYRKVVFDKKESD